MAIRFLATTAAVALILAALVTSAFVSPAAEMSMVVVSAARLSRRHQRRSPVTFVTATVAAGVSCLVIFLSAARRHYNNIDPTTVADSEGSSTRLVDLISTLR